MKCNFLCCSFHYMFISCVDCDNSICVQTGGCISEPAELIGARERLLVLKTGVWPTQHRPSCHHTLSISESCWLQIVMTICSKPLHPCSHDTLLEHHPHSKAHWSKFAQSVSINCPPPLQRYKVCLAVGAMYSTATTPNLVLAQKRALHINI